MIIVADAGPLLHLFWVNASPWALPPHPINSHAPAALQGERLRRVVAPISVSPEIIRWNLGRGEQAALSYALSQRTGQDVLVLCDERQARLACNALSLPVVGSIGLIVEAFRAGRISW